MYFFAILTAFISIGYSFAEIPEKRFCVNCKFRVIPHPIFESPNLEFARCKLFPKKMDLNTNSTYLVTGYTNKSEMEYNYCSTARANDDMCGEEGSYYKPSPFKKFFWKKCL